VTLSLRTVLRNAIASLAAGLIATLAFAAGEPAIPVRVVVTPSLKLGPVIPIWNGFGYDEPNYTYLPNGQALLASLTPMGPSPVYVRAHHMFSSGDGSPALKWGSTGMYREDAQGNPVYDFTIADRIVDTWVKLGLKPFMELGFMPEALSSKPEKYPRNPKPNDIVWFGSGFSAPPKDYQKWGDLCHAWAKHCVERHGRAEVATWRWQVWNEPNYGYWTGTTEDFLKLHDFAAEGIRRALPEALIGGPHTSSGLPPDFARKFFDHCLKGKNYANGGIGSPLDFIGFHAKGKPQLTDGRGRLGLQTHLREIDEAFALIARQPALKDKPIFIGESDPDGGAALIKPELGYRNRPQYASYTAASFLRKSDLAARRKVNLERAITWSFEFEHAAWFSGQRQLTTQGLDLPVRHAFRMFERLRGERISAQSDRQFSVDEIIAKGVREQADIGAFASRDGDKISVLLWHYHDDDTPGPDADVSLSLGNMDGKPLKSCRQQRIDEEHGNPFKAWLAMGSPKAPTVEQIKQLQAATVIDADAPDIATNKDSTNLTIKLPRQSVVLLEFTP
jgi:xylan 1,4-beta-xylosidase